HEDLHLGQREGEEAEILQQPAPGWERVGGSLSDAQILHAAAVRRTQKEDREQGIDQQDIFYCVVLFLAAITCGMCMRVLGADDASFRPVMGIREEANAVAGTMPTGADASISGVTMDAASVSETPRRCARAVRERVGASPRARSAPSRTGKRT